MGMFDYLRCEFPLPLQGANELEFQTKDTYAQGCDHYVIRADGTLWHQQYERDEAAEQDLMTGEVRFYRFHGAKEEWVEFSAYFVKGQLKHLEPIALPTT